jgi:hypothetical protein
VHQLAVLGSVLAFLKVAEAWLSSFSKNLRGLKAGLKAGHVSEGFRAERSALIW